MMRFCWTWRLSSSVRQCRAALPFSARSAAGSVCREGQTHEWTDPNQDLQVFVAELDQSHNGSSQKDNLQACFGDIQRLRLNLYNIYIKPVGYIKHCLEAF